MLLIQESRNLLDGNNVSLPKKILLNIVVFLLLFSPSFGSVDTTVLVAVGIGMFYLLRCLLTGDFKVSVREIILVYVIVYAFTLYAATDIVDIRDRGYYFARAFRSMSVYFSLLACIYLIRVSAIDLIRAFMNVIYVHLVFVYVQQFNFFGLSGLAFALNTNKDSNLDFTKYVGVVGLMTGHDGAGLLLACLSAMILVYYKNPTAKIVMSVIVLIGIGVTSRTGLITWGVVLAGYLLYLIFTLHMKKRYILSLIAIMAILFQLAPIMLDKYQDVPIVARTFEAYYMYQYTGTFTTQSSMDIIENHYQWPTDIQAYTMGIPARSAAIPGLLDSDIGYIQILFNFGVVNTIIILIITASWFNSFTETRHKLAVSLITLAILIGCLKGPYFFSKGIYDVLILYMVIAKLTYREKKQAYTEFQLIAQQQ